MATSYIELGAMIEWAIEVYDTIIVEEYIRGEEATATVIEGFRYQPQYVFPVAHIKRPAGAQYITNDHRMQSQIQHVTPSQFTVGQKKSLEDTARTVHQSLGLRHISHIDFIVTPRAQYVIDVNTAPLWEERSVLESMLASVGSNRLELLEHLIQIART